MTREQKNYINEISKNLVCSKNTRLKLLNGLKDELSFYTDLSYRDLCEKIGTPREISSQMMESINKIEVKRVKQIKLIPFFILALFFVILVGVLTSYYVHTNSIIRGDFYVKEETVLENENVLNMKFEEALRK